MMRLPPDVLLDHKVEALIAEGMPLPRWGFPTPRPYNGATGEERIRGWQKVRIAQRLGYLARSRSCGVCNASDPTGSHTEIYFRCMTTQPVCRSCHMRIHRRFADPSRWRAFLEDVRPESWAHLLLTEQLSRSDAMRVSAEQDWMVALKRMGDAMQDQSRR